MMFRRLVVLVGGPLLLCIAPVRAQDVVSSQTYGAGVHAYFAGDYRRAYDLLTSAIGPNSTSRDPRMYYFRALTFLRLGREDEAKQDFQQGAKLEATITAQTYDVPKSLERVQGADRQQLEQYRVTARIVAQQQSDEQNRARNEQQKREESRALLNQSQPSAAGTRTGCAAATRRAIWGRQQGPGEGDDCPGQGISYARQGNTSSARTKACYSRRESVPGRFRRAGPCGRALA